MQTQQLIAGGRHPELRGPRDAGDARRRWPRASGSTRAARDELDAAYRFLRIGRAPAADGRRRADPHAAGRPRGARPLRAFPRLCRPRRLRRDAAWRICATCSGTTRPCSRARRRRRPAARRCNFPAEADDRETLDKLTDMGFQQPLEVSALVRSWLAGSYRSLKGEFRPRPARRAGAGAARRISPARPIRTRRVLAFDRFLAGIARRPAGCSRCCGRIPI